MENNKEVIKVAAGEISVEQTKPDEVVITLAASKDRADNAKLRIVNADTHDCVDLVWSSNYDPKAGDKKSPPCCDCRYGEVKDCCGCPNLSLRIWDYIDDNGSFADMSAALSVCSLERLQNKTATAYVCPIVAKQKRECRHYAPNGLSNDNPNETSRKEDGND